MEREPVLARTNGGEVVWEVTLGSYSRCSMVLTGFIEYTDEPRIR